MEIVGYTNYLIYEDGRVWSKNRNKFMEIKPNKEGYKTIGLRNNTDKQRRFLIHRLVALHYLDKIEGKDCVDHIDGNKLNNNVSHYIPNNDNKSEVDHIDRNRLNNDVSNLRWVTRLENAQNIGDRKDNTSGHKFIVNHRKRWRFMRCINGKKIERSFKTKQEAIIYKFIFIKFLKHKFIS